MKDNRRIIKDREAIQQMAAKHWRLGRTPESRVPDTVTLKDMAKVSDYTLGSMYQFSTHPAFPSPVARRRNTLLWRREEFNTWLRWKKTPS